VKNNKNIKKKP